MKNRISALMDGELSGSELEQSIQALHEGGEALEAWRRYHLISDAFSDTPILSSGFSARFSERLALEPTVLAPASAPVQGHRNRSWIPLSAVASVAAIALVVFSYQTLGPEVPQAPQVAQVTQKAPERPKTANVPMSGAVNDYLLAHQNYSARNSLQGVAPYVRTVSESSRPR